MLQYVSEIIWRQTELEQFYIDRPLETVFSQHFSVHRCYNFSERASMCISPSFQDDWPDDEDVTDKFGWALSVVTRTTGFMPTGT